MPASKEFHLIPVAEIRVPEDRQRSLFEDIEPLAASISRLGILHPIVVTRDKLLVAGERRLRAVELLKHDLIPVQFYDELSQEELTLVELEENIKRASLTWQEDAAAHLKFHEGQLRMNDGAWTTQMSAELLGMGLRSFQRRLEVARELASGNEKILSCDSLGSAMTILTRDRERAVQNEEILLDETSILDVGATPVPMETGTAVPPSEGTRIGIPPPPWERNPIRPAEADISQENFIEWAEAYADEPFNFLHVDFPYGIGQHQSEQGSANKWNTYEDDPDTFFNLLVALADNFDKIVHPSAHIMFWLSMNYYEDALMVFQKLGCNVNYRPLIWWKSDNTGILPDALRGPRQTYEAALFISRGDRKVVSPVADCFAFPGSRRNAKHQSEKPWNMLAHFFRLFVDQYTTMLDPTCGCGNALALAWRLGANRVRGMDISQENVDTARKQLRGMRMVMAGETPEDSKKILDQVFPINTGIDEIDEELDAELDHLVVEV